MQVPSAMTIMPPEPSDEPASASAAWSRARGSMSAAVSTLVETPPGNDRLERAPAEDAAAVLLDELCPRVAELDLVDAGRLMWPEIEMSRVPGLFFVPILRNASAPWAMMPAMLASVSTLFTTVGRWYRPWTVSRGGRLRG